MRVLISPPLYPLLAKEGKEGWFILVAAMLRWIFSENRDMKILAQNQAIIVYDVEKKEARRLLKKGEV